MSQRGHTRVAVGGRKDWCSVGGARASGFAFRGDELLRSEALAQVIDVAPPEALPSVLAGLTGSFAAIKETPEATYAIVDNIRGIPLFCVDEAGQRVITDDPLQTCTNLHTADGDWTRRAEFLKSSSVSGGDTLVDDIVQVEAGSLLRVPDDPRELPVSQQWYAFRPNLDPDPSTNLVELAYETHRAAVERTVRFAADALVVVPLSAGLDSGILAALLAATAIDRDQILTFTFGRPGNRESEVSRRVAATLGLRWEFVPYSEGNWEDVSRQAWWPEYLVWASSLAGAPGFVDVPAVIELRRRGLVPDGSVVVPGHTLGFISGSFIPGSLLHRRRGSRTDVVDAVLATYYKYRRDDVVGELVGRPSEVVAEAVLERVDRAISESPPTMPREQLVSLTEEFGWRERQAKMIVNGVRAYEYHDLRWALPWWDREVLDFWARVPLRQRVGQRLRRELAQHAGWPAASRSVLDNLQERLDRRVRVLALDGPAKKLRNLARRSTRGSRYHKDELACLGLFGKERFLRSFDGTQTPRALLAEDVLRALDVAGPVV